MILLIDNYDSFSYNLYQLIGEIEPDIRVIRNDEMTVEEIRAARLAADHFGTGRYEYTASRNGYSTWSAWDAQGREWKFQKDVSIAGCDAEKCELVTPILKYEDIETLQELVRKLRKAGAISHAGIGAGVHIHIGANGHTPQTLRNLANLMASHERLIADADRKSTRLNSSHRSQSRMPSSA